MKVRPAIERMSAYFPPLESRNDDSYLLLDFNESTAPPSADAISAIKEFLDNGRPQAYPAYADALHLLGLYAACDPTQLILTNGCDQAIEIVLRALLEPGEEVVSAVPTFAMTAQVAHTIGASVNGVPYAPDMSYPLEGVLAAVNDNTRLIVVTNPNNPTGSSITEEQIRILLTANPTIPMMVDEAYFEFSGHTFAPLVGEFPNLVIVRTFSKAFAIAGLRLGYAVSNAAFIEQLYKVRGPYDVNILAVKAAEALLAHPEKFQAYVHDVMQVAKPRVEKFFRKRGVRFFPSNGNFLLVQPESVQEAFSYLKDNNILVRLMSPPIEHMFRVSIGTSGDMGRFMEVYGAYLNRNET